MAELQQSTTRRRLFKLIDSSDHLSKLLGATPTVELSKAGGAFAAASGEVDEVGRGWYYVDLATSDTNTIGDLAYYITAAGADDTDFVDIVTTRTGDTHANSITITVNDGTDPIQGATVTLRSGTTLIDRQTTNASGIAILTADAGTYSRVVQASGYESSTASLVVDGAESATVSLTAITITVSGDASLTTGYATCRNSAGVAASGIIVTLQRVPALTATPLAGSVWAGDERTDTSDANGLVEFQNMLKGGGYRAAVKREGVDPLWHNFVVPTTAGSTWTMPEVIGRV